MQMMIIFYGQIIIIIMSNIKKNTSGFTYTFPSFKLEKEMKKKKIKTFKFIDYLFIIKLSYIKGC